MKQYFLKISGFVAIFALLSTAVFCQDDGDKKSKSGKIGDNDEIIIKRKNDKDSKVTVEIKDGQVFVNGKPVDEYDDDNLSIRRRKIDEDGDVFALAPRSPFRGGVWNYNGDGLMNNSNRGFLGVTTENVDNDGGAEVREVSEGSAAEKIGLKKGDIITMIDNEKITGADDLTETIREHKPGDKVLVTYKRDGKEQKVTAELGKLKINYNYNYNFKMPKMDMDKEFRVITPDNGFAWNSNNQRIGIKAQDTEDGKGVKVLDVDDESAAEKAGIKEGDIITQFDGKEINSTSQLVESARAAKTKPSVKIKLNRDGKPQDVELKMPRKLRTADL